MNIAARFRRGLTVVRRRLNSIAVRLALWYGLSAFALVVVTTGSLYWALTVNLDREDALTLENHIQDLRLLLAAVTPDAPMTAPPVNGLACRPTSRFLSGWSMEAGHHCLRRPVSSPGRAPPPPTVSAPCVR